MSSPELLRIAKKVILITGASSGIGKDNAIALPADATSFKELESVVKKGVNHWGQLDVVFANTVTGLSKAGTKNGAPKEWDQLIDINVREVLLMPTNLD